RLASDPEKVITENFTYDHQNRLLKHYHKVDQLPQELLADNTYNEIGQLVNKKTGNTSGTPLQSVDYQYNIRGWLTKVNNPADLGDKLFGYALKYENPDHAVDAPAKYNGNISEFDWRTSTGNFLRRYAYKYDALNRLKEASYREPTATLPVNDGYSELLTYDLNGNIQTLKRFQALNNIPILIDDLKYKLYEGNRLKLVIDNSGNSSGYSGWGNMMSYDLNGNMTNHIDKGIKKIGYNYLNLPQTVLFGGKDKLQFLYRADGTKLKKSFTYFVPQTGMTLTQHTDYLDGFQYEQEHTGMPPLLQFFPTAEGYYDFQKKRYIYHYQDHVGNIRLAYYRGSNNEAIVDRETNYYPFGMEYIGFNGSQLQSYKYGFQGQERQAETGWSSFKWRNSIPELGRFFNIDPLAESYNTWSPYAFSGNRVVDARELEGLEPVLLPAYGVGAMTPPPMYSGKAGAGSSIYETAKSNAINNYNGIINLLGNNIKILTTLSGTGITIANRVLKSEAEGKVESEAVENKDANGVEITISDENKIPRDSLDPPTKPGNAPTFKKDGKPVEIHHEGQKAEGPFKEMHPVDHRGKGNYSKNHPKGQKPLTKKERVEFNNARQKYWKKEYPNGKKE
ncbi:HNH/ENDO VII family nuclease, partial [Chryseobacterium vrystaatense]|uniref:HNH/ENDO VII family nuclease n=1 Tax=Chryseobacterium vrystaatense TaxID=307480 RepID=UPI0029344043